MKPHDERSECGSGGISSTPRPIIVEVDGTASGQGAIAWAYREAGRRGARVRVLAGRDPEVPTTLDASMIVVGSASFLEMSDMADGSTAMAMAAHADVPVVVVRPGLPDVGTGSSDGRVVVGVDGTELSEAAVDFAFIEARDHGCGVTLVHAVEHEDERAAAEEMLTSLSAGQTDVRTVVTVADLASRVLIEESAGARLVVVGSRGHGGLGGMLLGSVSQAVVHRAHCPVAVVAIRREGYATRSLSAG
ncbi:nucleotide-binding universal stress UspA family protein [Actinoallomurus bryophytorum]|uniref:Nucleotide-binding universal stress UspA family protein n=1 Tax=Actinoallomurus bryophytorum TaxID=1490222 RepID=A0A543CVA4_9ACTN|nr:universal stress protein [Actinoallomurus bryophytorum]TQM00798.1 nucleotide-binding universal stress UspA family protein [Actinoallomurus bryophytorum]